ncbi:MAG: FG-GAP-like repeat-containing protein [Owenweeksia sp.]|nr:FG-GAP-like repeat-containing protein [Owenweeksia sp.]
MKFIAFCLLIAIATGNIFGQVQFELVRPLPPSPQNITHFIGVAQGSAAFADIDGDNDQDVLLIGDDNSSSPLTMLYTNDGNGNFEPVPNTPFDDIDRGTITFIDIDGDNDQDLFLTGAELYGTQRVADLYLNDGLGNFSLVAGNPFAEVSNSAVAFADIDGDNDADLLITGYTGSTYISELYTNNGSGNFSLVNGTPFDGLSFSSVAFADIDADSDQDLLITGRDNFGGEVSELYVNNGMGSFSLASGTPFKDVYRSSVAFEDVDGDNDMDIVITGKYDYFLGDAIAELYLNDGTGSFSLAATTPFEGVEYGAIEFNDVDNDNDPDLLITGQADSYMRISRLYINDGAGNFTQKTGAGAPFEGVHYSSVCFADVDADSDDDVLLIGGNSSSQSIAKLYINDSTGNFSLATNGPLQAAAFGDLAFADIDGDSDQDLLMAGVDQYTDAATDLYFNDGMGNYSLDSNANITGRSSSSLQFSDFDSDTDLDFVISGRSSFGSYYASLYTNNGSGDFTLVSGTPFTQIYESSLAVADVDGDNDSDIVRTGRDLSNQVMTKLFKNDGTGTFSLDSITGLGNVNDGDLAFADVDMDGDPDLLLTGFNDQGQRVAQLYANDGTGSFSLLSTPFTGVSKSSVAFSDVDGDNDPDLLLTGLNSSSQPITELYSNNGSGAFSLVSGTPFDGVENGSVAFADVDSNGLPDVIVSGLNTAGQPIAKLYLNNGAANFSLLPSVPFTGVEYSSVAFADIDGDNDSDVLITGRTAQNIYIAQLFRNLGCPSVASVQTITACDSLTWTNGITYTQNNISAKDTLTNFLGCDSIVTLNLTINHSSTTTDVISACDSYTWIDGVTYTSSNNTATHILTTSNGCDSLITLNLTIKNSSSTTEVIEACNQYTWIDGVTYTTSNNTASHTLTNSSGCDSTVMLDLTIISIDTSVTPNLNSLSANESGASYQWLDCNNNFTPITGATGRSFSPTVNGSYAVEITKNNCTDTSGCYLVNDVGSSSFDAEQPVKVFPNPTDGILKIRLGKTNNSTGINIYNSIGKVVESMNVEGVSELDYSLSAPKGVYTIEIVNSEGLRRYFRVIRN